MEKVLLKFNGNSEKFYLPYFETFLTEPMFPKLSQKHSKTRVLGRKVANHCLAIFVIDNTYIIVHNIFSNILCHPQSLPSKNGM